MPCGALTRISFAPPVPTDQCESPSGGHVTTMGILGKDDDPATGSGDGGTLGTPSHDLVEDVPSNDDDTMVVSGGGVGDASQDDAAAAGDRGLG